MMNVCLGIASLRKIPQNLNEWSEIDLCLHLCKARSESLLVSLSVRPPIIYNGRLSSRGLFVAENNSASEHLLRIHSSWPSRDLFLLAATSVR